MQFMVKITKKATKAQRPWTLEIIRKSEGYLGRTEITHHFSREQAISRAAYEQARYDPRVEQAAHAFLALRADVQKEYEAQIDIATSQEG